MKYNDDTGSVSCVNSKLNVTIPVWIEYTGAEWVSCPLPNHEIMQCTGFKDKKGEDIFEGDIVQPSYQSAPVIVEWKEKEGQWSTGFYNSEIGFEIIGNTYENPDLLTPTNL